MKSSEEFRADLYKIMGFALMTPLGKIVLYLLDPKYNHFNELNLNNLLIALGFFAWGVILLDKSHQIIFYEEIKRKTLDG